MSATTPFVSLTGRRVLLHISFAAAFAAGPLHAATQTTLPDLKEGLSGAALIEAKGSLYLIGGETDDGLSGRIDRLDLRTRTWEQVTDIMVPRKHLAAVLVDDEIFIFGGRGERGAVADVEVLDLNTGKLRDAAPMPTPRWFSSAALYKGEIFVAGGTFGWGRVATVEILDPATGEWLIGEPLLTARDTELVVVGNELLALGGFVGSGKVVSDIERYRPGAWQRIGAMPSPQSAFATAVVGHRVFILGDFADPAQATALDRLPLAKGGFAAAPVRGFSGGRHAAAAAIGSRVIVVGGEDARGQKLTTVQMLSAR